jgi:monovalent cation:H+ antiporter-2, CPA2 family
MTDLLVIFAISIGIVFVFHKFRLPPIAGFLAAGVLIEPHGLNLASESHPVHYHRREV